MSLPRPAAHPVPETLGPATLGAGVTFRDAVPGDVPALLAIEEAAFTTDRLSRRSFRELMAGSTARLRVAEAGGEVAGYWLLLLRQGTARARLYSIAVAPGHAGTGLGRALLADAEAAAYGAARMVLVLEVGVDNARARALYARAGYRETGRLADYYEDGTDALRMEKVLKGPSLPVAPPYYAQTTLFTCGSACLMMALAARDGAFRPGPVAEVRLWRAATTVFMTSGLGGCEAFGLALALAEHGLAPEIHVTEEGPLMLATVRNAEKRRVMELAQIDFQDRVAALGLPVHLGRMDVPDLAARLRRGAMALLLISGNMMFGKREPHWVLAYGADDGHVFFHDPWVEVKKHETETDAQAIPAPFAALERMWVWGKSRLRAAVIVPPAGRNGRRA